MHVVMLSMGRGLVFSLTPEVAAFAVFSAIEITNKSIAKRRDKRTRA